MTVLWVPYHLDEYLPDRLLLAVHDIDAARDDLIGRGVRPGVSRTGHLSRDRGWLGATL